MPATLPDVIDAPSPRAEPPSDEFIGRDTRWARPVLAALLAATAAFWSIGLSANGWGNSFYAAAVQAGTRSWKAFLFGSSDAGNSITVDKPPASLWVMEVSTRIFGMNTWALQLPQVLLGVASVGLVYAAVRRPFGPLAGLLSGALLALTPVATLMFRDDNPDALLVFLMVAAAWALLRGIPGGDPSDAEDAGAGGLRWVVLCGALIGLGFLTKQLQVVLVLPGMAIAYLVAAPGGWLRRIGHLLAGLAAAVLAAGWWVALVEFWPKGDRPYIGGSSDDSFLQLTLGYNGLGRILGGGAGGGGGLPFPPGGAAAGPGGGPGPMFGHAGITRLFTTASGSQISWLLPAALILLVAGVVLCRRARRTDLRRASYLVWGGWLLVTALTFSFMSGLFHDYYTVALAPGIAAVVGTATVHLWRHRETRWVTATLALALAVTLGWAWLLLGKAPDFLPWLRWAVVGVGALPVLGLLIIAVRPRLGRRRLAWWAGGLAVAAALASPVAYCVQTVGAAHSGPIVTAGPSSASDHSGPGGGPGGPGEEKASAAVTAKLTADAERYTWVAAARGSMGASGYQLASGHSVMPIGGFGGGDPAPTLIRFQQYVAAGRIHYYLDEPRHGMPPGGGNETPDSKGSNSAGSDSAGSDSMTGPASDAHRGDSDDSQAAAIDAWVKAHYTGIDVDGVTLYDLTAAPR